MKAESSRTDAPIDDLTYDLVTVLQHKARALEAYGKYLEDAESDGEIRELFERIRDSDLELVNELKEVLAHRLVPGSSHETMEEESPPPRRGESTQRR
jgi:hypothetical protein